MGSCLSVDVSVAARGGCKAMGARSSHLCYCGLGQASLQTVSSDGRGKVQEQAWGHVTQCSHPPSQG